MDIVASSRSSGHTEMWETRVCSIVVVVLSKGTEEEEEYEFLMVEKLTLLLRQTESDFDGTDEGSFRWLATLQCSGAGDLL